MNIRRTLSILLASLCLAAPVAFAYEAPSEGDLDALMANPNIIRKILGDANATEAADLMVRILDRIVKAKLVDKQRDYLASYYAARMAFLLGDEAEAFAAVLLPKVPRELVPPVLAGLTTGGRGSSNLIAALREMAGEDALLLQAINAPNITLTDPVYSHLVGNLGTAQSLPPVLTDSLPPPIPVGNIPGPRNPEVPAPYAGQGG
jgi:hypothetical protein